jgi:hypothetical protein
MFLITDLVGSAASQGAVRPYMVVPPKEASQADSRLPAIAVGTQVDLLILDCSPQPLLQDVVVAAFSS